MKRIELVLAVVLGSLLMFSVANCVSPAFGQAASSYVRRAGDTMAGTLKWSVSSGSTAIQLADNQRVQLGSGASTYMFGASNVLQTAATFWMNAMVPSTTTVGANAIAFQGNNVRLDLGTGSFDYLYSDGANVYTPNRFGTRGVILAVGTTLDTCGSTVEGQVTVQSGQSSGSRTKTCLCTSDGAGTPAYAWLNMQTAVVGTSTTCP